MRPGIEPIGQFLSDRCAQARGGRVVVKADELRTGDLPEEERYFAAVADVNQADIETIEQFEARPDVPSMSRRPQGLKLFVQRALDLLQDEQVD
jgi:hypothetical protein